MLAAVAGKLAGEKSVSTPVTRQASYDDRQQLGDVTSG
jgi:hypothetical protein